jgi:HlyD family secretion protein
MDRVIEKEKPKLAKIIAYAAVVLVAIYAGYGLIFSDFNMPTIDRDQIRIGVVKRGPLDVLISGNGVVTAKDPEWIVSKVSGQVIKSAFKAGEVVKKGDVIVELINEDVISDYAKSESELRAIKADYSALKLNLHLQLVDYESDLQKAQLDYKQANSFYEAVKILWGKHNPPISQIEYSNTSLKAEQMQGLVDTAKKKLASFKMNKAAQLDAFKFRLASAEEVNTRFKNKMNDLKITANSEGILQNLNLKVGQGVNAGEPIAQIVNPLSTYVTLNAPAIQAFKLSTMQKVKIELNKKTIQGVVHRIDPNVKGTTVDVDVYFDEEVKDAKIGMFVNGTIFIQSIPSALYIDIPSQVSENGNMSIFLLSADGKFANMTAVKSGALSSNYLQIVNGLKEGDKVILSDLPDSNNTNKLRLN